MDEPLSRRPIAPSPAAAERQEALAAELRRRAARRLGIAPERIAWDQPLTALGLDSLSAVEIQQEIESELGLAVALSSLLEGAGVRQLAAEALAGPAAGRWTDAERAAAPAPPPAHPVPGAERSEFPLSYGQRALWFLQQLAPASAAYHIAVAVRVRGDLDAAALRAALQAIAGRHPALRTTFHADAADGTPGPVQRVHAAMAVDFSCAEAPGAGDEELAGQLWEAARRPFALASGPLLRVALWRRAPDDHAMVLAVHHLVADFASLALVFAELVRLYPHREAAAALAAPAVHYADYVRWQGERLAAAGESLWGFWRATLGGPLPQLDLPTDRPRPAVATDHGALRVRAMEPELSGRVQALALASGATLFQTLLAAFMALLDRSGGRHDLLVGCPVAGRGAPELAGVVGYFVNPVVVRATPDDFAGRGLPGGAAAPAAAAAMEEAAAGGASFRRFLHLLGRRAVAAFEHQELPFALLAERLQPQRDPGR
ncbi:MAG TPA: condensation domain-containing protein, partial [Thermoanaerobaculia bacterium]|nr:condensation domain-containing protein [Thermoanaerobaculia bacterium]